jgi:dihydroxyacetone kinase-like predicted kinase
VHSDDIGAAIEAAVAAGRPHQIVVTPLWDGRAIPEPPSADRGVVAVVPGPGLARVFAAEGAITVEASPDSPPAVEELLAAVERTGAMQVVLLANDGANAGVADAVALAADRADGGPGRAVSVLHTRSPVQGIAALAVSDPHRPFREDVIAMAEAAAATRWAEVVIADQAAYTIAGPCEAGAVLSLVDGDVVAVGTEVPAAARNLLDRLLNAGGELVTLVTGAAADHALADQLRAHLRLRWPFSECQTFDGGQRHALLLLGVE